MENTLRSRFFSEVGADKRLAEPAKAIESRVQKLIDHVEEHGYVIIPAAFSPTETQEAREELTPLMNSFQGGPASSHGRNTFEGEKTQRIYSLANKSRVFDKFALHPDVLALNDHFFDPGYTLSSFLATNILPGEKAQTMHYDDGHVTVPRPRRPVSSTVLVAIDDFTAANGATLMIPKSHAWGEDKLPRASEAQPAVMASGSLVYFFSTLWHGAGANVSTGPRLCVTVQYCQPWLRPFENMILAVDWEKLDEMPPLLVDMLGYKVSSPFVGHVDGRSPRTAVAKLLNRRRRGDQSAARL